MLILRKSIFGDVFHSGILDDKTREMITITTLTTMQTLPQLKSHAHAALNNEISPIFWAVGSPNPTPYTNKYII